MEYNKVYSECFSNLLYSNQHHIQYDYIIDKMKLSFTMDETFSIVDVGSGRGQLIEMMKNAFRNIVVTSVDLEQFHNKEVNQFVPCDLSNEDDRNQLQSLAPFDLVVCTDVLEHLDKSFIDQVVETLSKLGPRSILAIANHSDIWDGVELHTIREGFDWWKDLIEKRYHKIQDTFTNPEGTLYIYDVLTQS